MLEVEIKNFFVENAIRGVLIVAPSLRNFRKCYKGGPNKEFSPFRKSPKSGMSPPPPINRSVRVWALGMTISCKCIQTLLERGVTKSQNVTREGGG